MHVYSITTQGRTQIYVYINIMQHFLIDFCGYFKSMNDVKRNFAPPTP